MQVSIQLDETMVPLTAASFAVTNAIITTVLETANNTFTATLTPITDGAVTVTLVPANIVDLAGNPYSGGALVLTRTYDTTAPSAPSILINSGSSMTTDVNSTLTLSASPPPHEMYVTSVSGCANGGSWAPYTSGQAYTLTANMQNTVYVKFRDGAGNESACVSDSILHDDIRPTYSNPVLPNFTKDPFIFTINFSEEIRPLSSSDFTVSNATFSISSTNTSVTLSVTPLATGVVQISLPAAKILDLAGNIAVANFQ